EEAAEFYGVGPQGYPATEYSTDTDVNPGATELSFTSRDLDAKELEQMVPTNLTNSQLEVLYNTLKELEERDHYDLQDVIDTAMNQESKAKWNLVNVLEIVQDSNIFADDPTDLDDLVEPGEASIINLKGVDPEMQEMVVYKLAKELFDRRKRGDLQPFFMIMEEAHNFVPERNFGKAICSDILRTIASEGRKFGLGIGVISQRPARVDKNILSQCNTQMILRVTNPNDLNAISRSFEGVTSEVKEFITSLPPGTGLLLGKEYPVMTDVRTRRSRHGGEAKELSRDDKSADGTESDAEGSTAGSTPESGPRQRGDPGG
ncbi:MAG: ATP-binding protein, partial [Candidatus Nanohaloarchaea archaeon]